MSTAVLDVRPYYAVSVDFGWLAGRLTGRLADGKLKLQI
jgi:hypothetical protein